jgi:acetylglutamate kinase
MTPFVLKIGGNEIDNPAFLAELARVVAMLPDRPVIVHGGGKEIGQLQMDLGIPYQVLSGLRVTSDAVLRVVEMVLNGLVNKRLVTALVNAGVPALGLSGVDLGLLRVEKMQHPDGDLGWVGQVVEVNAEAVRALLAMGLALVISPISLGRDGHTYNVNADHAAAALAAALGASALAFVTNVPGVLTDGGLVEQLTAQQTRELIQAGVISGGMVPKVQAALDALDHGVVAVKIVDLHGLQTGGGTELIRDA